MAIELAAWGDDPAGLDDDGLRDQLRDLARVRARLDAVELATLAAFDARGGFVPDGMRTAATWLRYHTHVARATGSVRVRLARDLRRLPLLAVALADGDCCEGHVRSLARCLTPRTMAAFARDEEVLVANARRLNVDDFDVVVTRWLVLNDPDGADLRHRQASRLRASRYGDGRVKIDGDLGFDDGAEFQAELDDLYTQLVRHDRKLDPNDPMAQRSASERYAAALVEMARRSSTTHEWAPPPDRHQAPAGADPHGDDTEPIDDTQPVDDSEPVDDIESVDDTGPDIEWADGTEPVEPDDHTVPGGDTPGTEAGGTAGGDRDTSRPAPPDLPTDPPSGRTARRANGGGGGPPRRPLLISVVDIDPLADRYGFGRLLDGTDIPRRVLDRWACDAAIARVVMAGRSTPIDLGTTTYTPSPAQRRALIARDRGCVVPGCDIPARWTDVHHVVPYPRGGTDLDKLALGCRTHHQYFHAGLLYLQWGGDHWRVFLKNGTELLQPEPLDFTS